MTRLSFATISLLFLVLDCWILITPVQSLAEQYLAQHSLQLHDFADTGRGIQTLIDRAPGDVLLKVPVEDSITVETLEQLSSSSLQTNSLTQEQQLALGLLKLKTQKTTINKNERIQSYITNVLPQEAHFVWNTPDVLWQSRLLSTLPRCYRETFQATREIVQDFAQSMSSNSEHSMEDLLWSFSMIRSRSIAVPELSSTATTDALPPLALLPGLDLFNHNFNAGTVLSMSNDNHWTLTSSHSYKAGDQIFLSYGDDKDNWKLLLTYGFASVKNPNAVAFWTWQDLLEAAGTVRPAIFSVRVQQSLLGHPQLQQYVQRSEDRATFSYDLAEQAPRDSLNTGLTLLTSLATQLGFPQDELLASEVLDELIRVRKTDLASCLAELQDQTDDWKPFLTSLVMVLQDELARLEKR